MTAVWAEGAGVGPGRGRHVCRADALAHVVVLSEHNRRWLIVLVRLGIRIRRLNRHICSLIRAPLANVPGS